MRTTQSGRKTITFLVVLAAALSVLFWIAPGSEENAPNHHQGTEEQTNWGAVPVPRALLRGREYRDMKTTSKFNLEGYPVRDGMLDFAKRFLGDLRHSNSHRGSCITMSMKIGLYVPPSSVGAVPISNTGCEKQCFISPSASQSHAIYYRRQPNITSSQGIYPGKFAVEFSSDVPLSSPPSSQHDQIMRANPSLHSKVPALPIPKNLWSAVKRTGIPSSLDFQARRGILFVSPGCSEDDFPEVRDLSNHTPVEWVHECRSETWADARGPENRADLYSRYKFVVAHPGKRSASVSEDLFAAFAANTVPIHFGTRLVHMLAPGKSSFVDSNQFSTEKDMATFIQKSLENYASWSGFFEWKRGRKSPWFGELEQMSAGSDDFMCRVCDCLCSPECSGENRTLLNSDQIPSFDGYVGL